MKKASDHFAGERIDRVVLIRPVADKTFIRDTSGGGIYIRKNHGNLWWAISDNKAERPDNANGEILVCLDEL